PPLVGESVASVGIRATGVTSAVVYDLSTSSALVVALASSDDSEVGSPVSGASDAPVAGSSAGGGSGRITGVTTGSGSVPESSPLVGEPVGSIGSTATGGNSSVVEDDSPLSALVVELGSSDDSEVESSVAGASDAPVAGSW